MTHLVPIGLEVCALLGDLSELLRCAVTLVSVGCLFACNLLQLLVYLPFVWPFVWPCVCVRVRERER